MIREQISHPEDQLKVVFSITIITYNSLRNGDYIIRSMNSKNKEVYPR